MLQAYQWLTDTENLWDRKAAGLLPKIKQAKKRTTEANKLKTKLSDLIAAPHNHRSDTITDLTAKGHDEPELLDLHKLTPQI